MQVGQNFDFSAAHKLQGNKGEPLHGHNYKLQVVCKGKPNDEGKALDTREMRTVVEDIVLKKLHNSFLNDFFPQPTMENIVRWVWEEIADMKPIRITLWENPNSFVLYEGKD
jgi:6-pyruvoyltetrahydropterin/6-carboxytetrahydropterin synthase